jgi:hypothetical protein
MLSRVKRHSHQTPSAPLSHPPPAPSRPACPAHRTPSKADSARCAIASGPAERSPPSPASERLCPGSTAVRQPPAARPAPAGSTRRGRKRCVASEDAAAGPVRGRSRRSALASPPAWFGSRLAEFPGRGSRRTPDSLAKMDNLLGSRVQSMSCQHQGIERERAALTAFSLIKSKSFDGSGGRI